MSTMGVVLIVIGYVVAAAVLAVLVGRMIKENNEDG